MFLYQTALLKIHSSCIPFLLFSFVHFLGLPLIYLTFSHLNQIIIFTRNIHSFFSWPCIWFKFNHTPSWLVCFWSFGKLLRKRVIPSPGWDYIWLLTGHNPKCFRTVLYWYFEMCSLNPANKDPDIIDRSIRLWKSLGRGWIQHIDLVSLRLFAKRTLCGLRFLSVTNYSNNVENSVNVTKETHAPRS